MTVEVNITDQIVEINESSNPVQINETSNPVEIEISAGATIAPVWGNITGTLSNQTDLQNALNAKVPYTGAIANVNLGEFELKAGQMTLDLTPTGTAAVGTTRWNDTIGSSETTLKGGSVILKNGIDLVARVVNKVNPNQTLTKSQYQAVRVSGAQGQRLAVALAQANNDNNSADTIGLVTETIATNQEGFIMTVGQLENVNTTGSLQGENWTDGDVLYLSPTTAGRITNVKPVAPNHVIVIGYVEYAHQNNGKIYVKIMNGWELGELHDVDTTGATAGQVLKYNGTIWTPSGDVGITSLNGLNATTQTFATGTSGTDFNISSATSTHTFNLPTASGTNRGLLSSADWTTFNSKQNALTNPITGTGSAGQVAYFTGTTTQAGSSTFLFTPTTELDLSNSVTASSAIARGARIRPTLLAAANNDVLVGLDINPTFTNGAFTGVSNIPLRITQNINSSNENAIQITNTNSGILAATRIGLLNDANNSIGFFISSSNNNGIGLANTGVIYATSNVCVITNISAASGATGTYSIRVGGNAQANERFSINELGNATISNNLFLGATLSTLPPQDRLIRLGNSGILHASTFSGTFNLVLSSNVYFNGSNNVLINAASASSISFQNGNIDFINYSSGTAGSNAVISGNSRIFANGNFAIGSTTDGGERFQVTGNARVQGVLNHARMLTTSDIQLGSNVVSAAFVIAIGQELSTTSYTKVSSNQAILIGFGNGNNWGTVGAGEVSIGQNNKLSTGASANGSILLGNNLRSTSTGASLLLGKSANDNGFTVINISQADNVNNFNFTAHNQGFLQVQDLFLGNTIGTGFSGGARDVSINGHLSAGTNISGGNFTIASGRGTGTGTPGNVIFSTSSATTTGTTLQSLTERMRIFGGTGNVVIQDGGTFVDNGFRLDVNGNARIQGTLNTTGNITVNNGTVITENSISATGAFTVSGYNVFINNANLSNALTSINGYVHFGDTAQPPASSQVTITSTTRGFLPPRMTSTQRSAIASPAVGLLVYQTNGSEGLYQYTNSGWQWIAGAFPGTVTSVGLTTSTGGVTITNTPITSSGNINIEIATASATATGLLTSADWTTFNNKQNALTNPITGTGTSGQVAYFTGATTQAGSNNLFWDNANARLGINTNAPLTTLYVRSAGPNTTFDSGALLDARIEFRRNAVRIGLLNWDSGVVTLQADSGNYLGLNAGGSERARIFANGNFGINTGATDSGQRLQVVGTGYFSDSVGIGTTTLTGFSLLINHAITSGAAVAAASVRSTIQSQVTTEWNSYQSLVGTQAATFTLGSLRHFSAQQSTFGANSVVTNQFGFKVDGNLTGATNNFAFHSDLNAATGRWNLYMNGTANNYMAGSLGIGSTSLTGYGLRINKDITGATSSFGVSVGGQILSDVTSTAALYATNAVTQNATFTLTNLNHFRASQGTFGASSTVTNQYGYVAENTLISAANNFGFYGNIAAATGRWNFYANGTAQNYFAGNTGIGVTTPQVELAVYSAVTSRIQVQNATSGTNANDGFQLAISGSEAYLWNFENGNILFGTNATERMRLNASGNLGLGVTPSAWSSVVPAFQIGSGGSFLAGRSANPEVYLGTNARFNGTNWIYQTTNTATYYAQDTGRHIWYNAPSGTAGNAITFTQAMTLTAAGRLLLGTTTEGTNLLDVNGTARITGALSAVGTFNLQRSGSGADTTIQFRNEVATNRAKIVFGGTNEELGFYAGAGTTEHLRISNAGIATFSNKIITQSGSDAIEIGTPSGNNYRSNLYIKGTDGSAGAVNAYFGVNVFSTTGILDISNTNGISMRTSGSERLSIASTGASTFSSSVTSTQFRLSALNTAPATSSSTGTLGEIRIDADYIYICTATNTWKRVAIATF